MPPEPKKPIEEMLEASAKERRAAFGSDPKMPNPMRVRLHEEIARLGIEEKTQTAPTSWLEMFWPRVAVAAALATLLVVVPAMWWRASHPSAGLAMKETERGPAASDEMAVTAERQKDDGKVAASAPADEVLSKGPAVVAAAPPSVSLADNERAKLEPEQTPAEISSDSLAETKRLADAKSSSALTKGYFSKAAPGSADQSVAAARQAQPAAPVTATAPASAARDQSHLAAAPSAASAVRGAKQQFAQRSAAGQAFRNNAQTGRAATVLNNFQVEQQGSQIRIVDADGSTYTGKFEPIAETANRAVAKLKEDGRLRAEAQSNNLMQQARFRATGYNVSLKRSLVFEGDYVGSSAPAEQLKAEKRADIAPQPQEAARIVGRATVTGETPVEVDAVAVPEETPAQR